jgi:23S rRNA (adenine-N6)-dimethyltransferase
VPAKRRRTARDRRRRELGQNFLVDRHVVERVVRAVEIERGELVVEVGAGTGTMTVRLARAGARVIAIEPDPAWARRVQATVERAGLADRVELAVADFQDVELPDQAYRVVANPPFNLTTALLAALLDDPGRGPLRADLVIQREVARKHAAAPPSALRTAAWAPWWSFEHRFTIGRYAFRPIPSVEAALLTIRRRDPPVLPHWLAPAFRDLLRDGWAPPHR